MTKSPVLFMRPDLTFPTELALQNAVVQSWRHHHPEVVFNGCPGGVNTSISQGRKLKQAGYRKGWPDLFFATPKRGHLGLFIELKTEKGQLRKDQRGTLSELSKAGYCAVCAKGWNAAEAIRIWYMEGEGEFPRLKEVRRF